MNKRTISAIKRHRTRRLATLLARAAYLYRRKQFDRMANVICDEFVSLGGVYIKFLQGVLLRSDIMKRWHNPDRLKVFENLDSEPLDIAEVLRSQLSPEKLAQISLVQPQPFAAGSFGQVYFANLRDGTPVVIKVLRPMIRELLNHDLRLLTVFYRQFFSRLYKNIDFDLDKAVGEFKQATKRETDYRHEADFANELYQVYKNHPKVEIPKTYMDLCTDDIIVQGYMDGLSVATLVKLADQGVDPKTYVQETLGSDLDEQLRTLGYEAMMGVFNLPRIMGDPHPGNIRLLRDNKVGLIDFGISAKSPKEKSAFFGLIEAYSGAIKNEMDVSGMFERALQFFVGDLYQALNRIGQFFGAKTVKNVTKIAGDLFEQTSGSEKLNIDNQSPDISVLMMMNRAINKGNRFGLVMKLENSEILRATQTFTSMVSALGRSRQVTPKVLEQVVRDIRAEHPEYTSDMSDHTSLSEAVETVAAWLERVALRDPALFQKLSSKVRSEKISSVKPEGEPSNA